MIPAIVTSNVLTSWAYLKPESFKEHFSQSDLIKLWVAVNSFTLILHILICRKAVFNVHGLWLSIPFCLLGLFLIGYAYNRMGTKRTFFGQELGVIEDEEPIEGFPFSLGHAQYKGFIILLLGIWFAFRHNHELTAMTGIWIISFLVQMLIETPPHGSVPDRLET